MEENIGPASSEQSSPPPPSEWFSIWVEAVARPSERNYIEIARRGDLRTGLIWLSITYLVLFLIILAFGAVTMLFAASDGAYSDLDPNPVEAVVILAAIGCCGALGYVALGVGMICLITALSHAIAKAFGGTGDFGQLLYCVAAYTVPTTIVSIILSVLAQIPCVGILFGLLSTAIGIYTLVLNVTAIKAVHYIETGQAFLSSTFMLSVALLVVFCVVIGILSPEGLSVSNIFSNVIEGLDAGY